MEKEFIFKEEWIVKILAQNIFILGQFLSTNFVAYAANLVSDKFWDHGRFLTFDIHSPSQLIQDDKSFCEEIIKTKNHGSISQII